MKIIFTFSNKVGHSKLQFIKTVKDLTGWGLKESKDWVDLLGNNFTPMELEITAYTRQTYNFLYNNNTKLLPIPTYNFLYNINTQDDIFKPGREYFLKEHREVEKLSLTIKKIIEDSTGYTILDICSNLQRGGVTEVRIIYPISEAVECLALGYDTTENYLFTFKSK